MAARRLPCGGALAPGGCRPAVLLTPGGNIAVDGVGLEGLEILFRAVAGIGGQFVGQRPCRLPDRLDHRTQLMLITAAGGQPMGDDDLMGGIGRSLGLVWRLGLVLAFLGLPRDANEGRLGGVAGDLPVHEDGLPGPSAGASRLYRNPLSL